MTSPQPWNELILIWESAVSDAWYKGGAVLTKLRETYNIPETQQIHIRTKEITAWGKSDTSEASQKPIGMEVFSAMGSQSTEPDILRTVMDAPGKNHRAVVHYKWKQGQEQQPRNFNLEGTDEYVFGLSGPVDVVHLKVSWKIATWSPETYSSRVVVA